MGRPPRESLRGRTSGTGEYVAELGHALAGDLRRHYVTPRYNGVGHEWNGVTSGILTLTPELTIYEGELPQAGDRPQG